jgi:hypothetical protein
MKSSSFVLVAAAVGALLLAGPALPAGGAGPTPQALLSYLKAREKAARLSENALEKYLPKEIAVCPKFHAVPSAYWPRAKAVILQQGSTWAKNLGNRKAEVKAVRGLAILALSYEPAAAQSEMLGIVRRLKTDLNKLIGLDAHLVTAFTHLGNRQCPAAHSDYVRARPIGIVRILVDDDMTSLTTFLKTHH